MKFVNVYGIDRRYGGSEEGGWYYNNYKCLETYPTREENADEVVKFLKGEYSKKAYGDIYSVRGGLKVEVILENKPGESETKEKPRYE